MAVKKVGILTFHRAFNYGAALQAYALLTTIKKLGYSVEIIDYGRIGATTRFPLDFTGIKPFLYVIYMNLLSLGNADIRRYRFRAFQKEAMQVSQANYLKRSELQMAINHYDTFIVGSDQVWNPNLTFSDKSYLLDFTGYRKKISYAASFGINKLPNELIKTYMELLSKFDSISVRERTGARIVNELTGHEPIVTLDPTLLLSSDEWSAVRKPVRSKKPYILCYNIMNDPPGFMDFCRTLQQLTGFQILRIANPLYMLELGVNVCTIAGPREFIGLFEGASMIVTNSFHGTAFSIIYRKPFYTFLYNNDRDIRLKEITEKLGLEDRLVNPKLPLKLHDLKNIDYVPVCEKLEKQKLDSIKFLKDALIE